MIKGLFYVVIVCTLMSSCAGLPRRKTGVAVLNKSNYKKINELYHNQDGVRNLGSFTNTFDISTKSPDFCSQCYIRIDAVSNRKLNVTLIDSGRIPGDIEKTFVFHGRIGKGGYARRYMLWDIAWGPFDGYALAKCRIYVTPHGNLIIDRTAFAGAGFLIILFMVDSKAVLGTEIVRVDR